ncbi:MAG TPA: hypothetical protein VEQ63_01275, partial [Bryobacteraceae bacterium]|nr:hypothetical protein [Bryobacteraceae bacterium]
MALRLTHNNLIDVARGHASAQPALVDTTTAETLSYGQLLSKVDHAAEQIGAGGRRLAFLFCSNTPGAIIAYLGCLAGNVPVCLLDGRSSAGERITSAYHPPLLMAAGEAPPAAGYRLGAALPGGFTLWERPDEGTPLHPDLTLLLTTSGSTGDPKL